MKFFRQLLLVLAILPVSVRPGIAQPTVQAPVANPATFAVNEATRTNPTTLTGTLIGTDPNNASLTFRLSTPPSHGSATVDPSGSFTYKLDPEYAAADSFGFIANNGSLDSVEATVIINVTPGHDPPNAYPIYATIPTNGILYGQLLGDEIEDDVLAYSTYSIVSQPQNGTVTVDPNFGQFLYTPNSNVQSGTTDSFTYTVYDGAVYSLPATVSIVIGSDSVGFIADTAIANVGSADLANIAVYSPPTAVSGPAVDEAVDRANQRLYVLTAKALNIYDITDTTGAITPSEIPSVTLNFAAERIALSLDGRTAYIGSKGQVTAINLYPEYVFSGKGGAEMPAYTYLRTYSFGMTRDVAAMGVHPAGDRLYVVIDMDPASKKLNINNNLLLSDAGNGTTAAQALATARLTDYGFLTYLDISADLAISQANQTPAKFVTPFNLMNLSSGIAVLDIRKIAFSPDGNYALICGVGAQSPRITPFGVMPTSDVGTGGTLVVDVRRYTDQSMSTPPVALANPYLGFIPDTEYGENTAALRLQIVQKGATIIHPDVLAAGLLLSAAQGATDVSLSAGASGLGLLPDTLAALYAASDAYDLLWQTYQDYGNMQAYFDLYPRNMVGASGVAINHTGDFGVVTMQDTNNLGLLKLSLTRKLSGYSRGSPLVDDAGNPSFNIARGTGKTVNGFIESLSNSGTPALSFEWAYPQTVAFTSDDTRIFIGLANGGYRPDNSHQAGTADALHLKTARDDPKSVFLSNSPPPGYVLAGNGGFLSPRLATAFQSFDSSRDSLSDQLKAYNRWNSLRPLSQIPQALQAKLVSTDPAHLTIPGTPLPSDPKIPDSLNVGFFLPLSGIGYRLNTFGMPADTTNFATRGVVTALEQIGLLWNQLYHNPGYQPPPGSQPLPGNLPPITRPYFIVGLLSQPGGGIIQNLSQEPITNVPGTGNEADFPYLKLNSDEAFNFVPSAGPNSPTNNTGETKVGFDEPNSEALIRLLLSNPKVTTIELDPYPLALMPPDIQSDFRLVPHGNRTDPNSRRDLSNHMHVTFTYSHVSLSIDADNNGVIDNSATELGYELQVNGPGKIIPANNGFIGDVNNQGIPDYADGYDLFPGNYRANASAAFAPMIIRFPDNVDLSKIQFRLTYDESDPSQVTQQPNPAYDPNNPSAAPQYLYVLPSTGSYRIWTKDGPSARLMAGIDQGGDFIASNTLYKVTDLLARDPPNKDTDRSFTVYIEAVKPGTSPANVTINGTIGVTLDNGSQSSIAPPPATVPVSGQYIGLAVDTNRDGEIHFSNENVDSSKDDSTSADKPFRFWLNDDVDRHNQVDTTAGFGGYDVQDDLNPSAYQGALDWNLDTIPGTRDLEDWTRLWVDVGGLRDAIVGGNMAIGLKWVGDFTNGNTPAIKLLQAVESDGGNLYLTDPEKASAQVTGVYSHAVVDAASTNSLIQPTDGTYDFVIPQTALGALSANNTTIHFLFEGCQRGKGQLTIVLLKKSNGTYTTAGASPGVYLDLKDIKEMYERWTVGEGNGTVPSSSATIATTRLPPGVTGLTYQFPVQSPEQNQYILYVHGWNMEPWEKDAFAETAFKRLYWQGYRGRFGTFQWPTTFGGLIDSARGDYDIGEHSAWQSAAPLAALLASLSSNYGGNVYVLAHSMGNVVTGEALRLAAQSGSGSLVKTYIASQAAVPGEAWDATLASRSPLTFHTGSGPDTPDIYGNWLTMTSGHGSAVGTKVNFYNTTDYALNIWQINEILKPDWYLGTAYYYASFNLTTVADLFKTAPAGDLAAAEVIVTAHTGLFPTPLHLGDASNAPTTDRYTIMAFDAEPRSLAIGATSNRVSGFSSSNLQRKWPADNLSSLHDYSEHPWHSAQFRFTNADQQKYWHALLGQNGFDLLP